MLVTLFGMVMLISPELRKASISILVKLALAGKVTLARLVQLLKAPFPILVTLSGMIMLVRLAAALVAVELPKALTAMLAMVLFDISTFRFHINGNIIPINGKYVKKCIKNFKFLLYFFDSNDILLF